MYLLMTQLFLSDRLSCDTFKTKSELYDVTEKLKLIGRPYLAIELRNYKVKKVVDRYMVDDNLAEEVANAIDKLLARSEQ